MSPLEDLKLEMKVIEGWLSLFKAATSDVRTKEATLRKREHQLRMVQQNEAGIIKRSLKPTFVDSSPKCPTPQKHAFPEDVYAFRAALSASRSYGKAMRVYECVCGNWHMTKKVSKR
jgi:hypothetical protein